MKRFLSTKNGKEIYVIENITLCMDQKNGGDMIEGVIIDITERKKTEKSIKVD